ncbi:MAG TPA: carboxypeptidase-like regulatory domain-containing protein, partial [Bryobacteraceae bacterium]
MRCNYSSLNRPEPCAGSPRAAAWLLIAASIFAGGLHAQQAAVSQISGMVRDPAGLGVPGAKVTVSQTTTGLTRSVQTGPDGAYTIPSLPIGPYRMSVAKEGFSSYVQEGVVLQVDSNPVIDVALKIGSLSQEVVVQADANMVETHSTGVGQVVDQQRVVELPLNGRNATQLIFVAGAASTGDPNLNTNKNYPTVSISVAGGPSNAISYLLDGAMHNDPENNLNQPIPFPDALQEFKVETSALPAQYGYQGGATVNAVTKSGGNEFHGDAFEFLRNGDLNARNAYAVRRDSLKRNQFGGTLGGPVKRNKLFFFAGYQGTIQRSDPTTGIAFVPTAQMLAGDFTQITAPVCNANRQITLKTPFVNNRIDPALLSQPAVNLTKRLPTPTDGCGTVRFGTVSNSEEYLGLARADYQINTQQTLFFRYYIAHLDQLSPYNNNDPLTITAPFVTYNMQFFALGHTYVINPTTINSFHASLNRGAIVRGS